MTGIFCSAVICAPHLGQAERGTTRLYGCCFLRLGARRLVEIRAENQSRASACHSRSIMMGRR